MNKYFVYLSIALFSTGLFSCDDDENYDPALGLTSVQFTPYDNAVGYTCHINQTTKEIDNDSDPVAFDVSATDLQRAVMTVNTTLGVGLQLYCNGTEVTGDNVTVDLTNPVDLEVRGYNKSVHYTFKSVNQATSIPEDEPVLLKSTNMRAMGIDPNTYSYQVTYFNNEFLCFASAYDSENDLATYHLYSSDNGVKWTERTYGPDAVQAVGGQEATLRQWGNRLYVLGGARCKGTDAWGNAAESSWGMPACDWWRSHSTTDGTTFRCDTVGVKGNWVTSWGSTSNSALPSACAAPNVAVFNNKMYLKGAHTVSFYQWQGSTMFKVTEDGTNWTTIPMSVNNMYATRRLQDAFFVFKGKLWSIGGFRSYITANNLQQEVYSSEDAENWVLENEEPPFGKMFGMKAAVKGDEVVYLIGGEYFNEDGQRELSNRIYRSTDGIHWEEVEVGSKYTARRNPQIAVKDGYAYIFGGYTTPTSDYYGFPTSQVPAFDTFVLELK